MSASTPSRSNAMRRDIRAGPAFTPGKAGGDVTEGEWKVANSETATDSGRVSEESLAHQDCVAGLDDVGELALELLLVAFDDAHDRDTVHGTPIGDSTRERQRLKNARVFLLQRICVRVLDLTEDVHGFSPRKGDRIAVPEHDVLPRRAVLESPQVDRLSVGILRRK